MLAVHGVAMTTPRPTADDVKTYRDKHECVIYQARVAVWKDWRELELRRLRLKSGELYTVEACRDVIVELLDFLSTEIPE